MGGVLIHEGKVLLIRRGKEPLRGRWVVPGGTVELGETLEEALVREMREETGLTIEPVELVTVFDRIQRESGKVVYHYVIADYLCRYLGGEARAGSDARGDCLGRPGRAFRRLRPARQKALEVVQEAFRKVAVS